MLSFSSLHSIIQNDIILDQFSPKLTCRFNPVSIGLDEAEANRPQLDIYHKEFQAPFLTATVRYYQAESAAFIANNSVSDYLKKAESRLEEEADRVNLYLNDSTRTELKKVCEEVLIRDHQEIMWDEFQLLLDADRTDGE